MYCLFVKSCNKLLEVSIFVYFCGYLLFLIDMNRFISILLLCLLMPCAIYANGDGKNGEKKNDEKTVYVWGVSIAFPDSVVYFTEIQPIDGVVLENKLLPNRHLYSYELKDYMSFEEGKPGRTSFIYFSTKRSKLEKKELKIRRKLIERENKTVRYLGGKFKFTKH